jgi:hypothetical protein
MKKVLLTLLLVPSMMVAMENTKNTPDQLFREFDETHTSVLRRAWLTQGAGFALLHPAIAERIISGENTPLSGLISYYACVFIGQAVLHTTLGGLTGLHKAETKLAAIEAQITKDVIQDAFIVDLLDRSMDGISVAHHVNGMKWSYSGYNRWAGWRLGRAIETKRKGLTEILEK